MNKRKYAFLSVCTVLLLSVLALCFFAENRTLTTLYLQIDDGSTQITVEPYFAQDGTCHLFLPAHCEPENIMVRTTGTVRINDAAVADKSPFQWENLERVYRLETEAMQCDLRFWQATDVATLYIDTRSGTMEQIHKDKNYREAASMRLYQTDGTLNYVGDLCTIKGRGNATWNCRKKPYNLQLSSAENLLGIGNGTDWVLLANALDQSNLFNALAFDLAQRTQLGWTPGHAYVELYLNGSYNGLYLLTRKVQSGEDGLQLQTQEGDFLAQIEPNMRKAGLDDPILTRSDRVIELCEPEYADQVQRAHIEQMVDHYEQAILSASDQQWPQILDMDSFARRYLIDEICANIDADLASAYFQYRNGRFYAGPVWDFDMAFGNQLYNENPAAFVAKNEWRSKSFQTPYDTALLKNVQFHDHVTQLYRTEFLPILEQWLDEDIARMAATIDVATQMNTARWAEMFEKNPFSKTTAQGITDYLRERVDFLSEAWIEGKDFCTLQFEIMPGSSYWNLCVERGTYPERDFLTMHPQLQYLELDDLDVETEWIVLETGEVFDFEAPVTQDLILVPKVLPVSVEQPQSPAEEGISAEVAVALVCCSILGVLMLGLGCADIRRRWQERRKER